MAQHTPVQAFQQPAFRKIEAGITRAFLRGNMRTSMVYEYTGEQEGLQVYTTTRRIPKGIVYGDTWGLFEIHYEPKSREIKHLFLVA